MTGNSPDERQLFFLHIPKTAGTSVRRLLESRIDKDKQLLLLEERELEENSGALHTFKLVAGHLPYAFSRRLKQPFILTFLRDPLERALSSFDYFKTLSDEELQRHLGALSAEEVKSLRHDDLETLIDAHPELAKRELGERQTADLTRAGDFRTQGYKSDSSAVAAAKHALREIEFVGLTERMDDSLALLFYHLGWELPEAAPYENKTPKRTRVDDLSVPALNKLKSLCALDSEVYEFGRGLFEERLSKAFSALVNEHSDVLAKERSNAPERIEYTFDRGSVKAGWHIPELFQDKWVSWTGPQTCSWIQFPIRAQSDLQLTVHICAAYDLELFRHLTVKANGQPLFVAFVKGPYAATFECAIPASAMTDNCIKIEFEVPHNTRPCEIDPAVQDDRLVGICVEKIIVDRAPAAVAEVSSQRQSAGQLIRAINPFRRG